jgi:hypothetical protein
MNLVGSKGQKTWMEWNSFDLGILSQACGLDLPTCIGCTF